MSVTSSRSQSLTRRAGKITLLFVHLRVMCWPAVGQGCELPGPAQHIHRAHLPGIDPRREPRTRRNDLRSVL